MPSSRSIKSTAESVPHGGGGAWETELAERQDVFLGHQRRQALGSVIANANLGENGPDALVFALDQVPQAAQHIDRGSLTPLRVSEPGDVPVIATNGRSRAGFGELFATGATITCGAAAAPCGCRSVT
jgi:hypothetical protein